MSSAQQAWRSLATEISGCMACPELAATRTTTVVGAMPLGGAQAMLVGEAPGATEDETGMPFVGKAGRLLDELLGEAGISRDAVAVANVLKCRPPGNRKPTRSQVSNCRGWLTAQLAIVDPAVVVALGGTAVEWFFGTGTKIGPLRGRLHEVAGRRVLATYHPSAALRFGPGGLPRAALREDLAMLASELAAEGAR